MLNKETLKTGNILLAVAVCAVLVSLLVPGCGGSGEGTTGGTAQHTLCPKNIAASLDAGVSAPSAYYQDITIADQSPVNINLLACDTDTPDEELRWYLDGNLPSGLLSASSGTYPFFSVNYDPAGFEGVDRFNYRVSDGSNESNSAEVRISVSTPPLSLVGIGVHGPGNLDEGNSSSYSASAYWSDSSTTDVTTSAAWAVTPGIYATINGGGILTAGSVPGDQAVTVSASYNSFTDSLSVTIVDISAGSNLWYVDINAPAVTEDGLSWGTALSHPSPAVSLATAGDTIYVAAGAYAPLSTADPAVPLLVMNPGVEIYGGYSGDVVDPGEISGRSPTVNLTVLNGDADTDGTGDIYNVVWGASDALLDGFKIINGNANGTGLGPFSINAGGGMFNDTVLNLTVRNCVFSSNTAAYNASSPTWAGWGGGIASYYGSVTVTGSTFSNNLAVTGGGMFARGSVNGGDFVTIDNCTFDNNTAVEPVNPTRIDGGGLFLFAVSDVTIRDCTFSNNTATKRGGGVQVSAQDAAGAFAIIENTTFTGNRVTDTDIGEGGGLYLSLTDATVTNSVFDSNYAGLYGGGLYVFTSSPHSATISTCAFTDNSSANSGGGLFTSGGSQLDMVVTAATFDSNQSQLGGGLAVLNTNTTVSGCDITRNSVSLYGGGLYSGTGTLFIDKSFFGYNQATRGGGVYRGLNLPPLITNNIFYGNTSTDNGGAIYFAAFSGGGYAEIANNTFSENSAVSSGGGISSNSSDSSFVTNCIFWGDTGSEIDLPATVIHSDVQMSVGGTYPGVGNINLDPAFASTPDLFLSAGSSAINAGTDTSFFGVTTDFSGTARPQGSAYDMGAWEF